MKDILDESGLSQGSIYHYYKNIDNIFFALLSRGAEDFDIKRAVV